MYEISAAPSQVHCEKARTPDGWILLSVTSSGVRLIYSSNNHVFGITEQMRKWNPRDFKLHVSENTCTGLFVANIMMWLSRVPSCYFVWKTIQTWGITWALLGLYSAWNAIFCTPFERLFIFLHIEANTIRISGGLRYGRLKIEVRWLSHHFGARPGIQVPGNVISQFQPKS